MGSQEEQQLVEEACSALGLVNPTVIGKGGQKVILRGSFSGQAAAGKIIFLTGNSVYDEETLTRARREVELLATVDSSNVVRVLTDAIEVGEPPRAIAWVEEWLDGSDLSERLGTPLPENETWRLLKDLASALDACHSLDVVHRDLSPNNVRRKKDGTYVLMDPGLAKHLAKTAITGAFQPGTPGWRSPEHVLGGDPVPSSDIFCLGLLAFFAITGEPPIPMTLGPDEYDRVLLEEQIDQVESRRGATNPHLAAVVNRCLQRQPARRYIDGSELFSDISQAEEGV